MLDYLRNPRYLASTDETIGEDNFLVLTDRATIRNLIEGICNTLHHPVTILDFNRLVLDNNDDSKYRIDSEIELFSLRYACKLLRKCAGSSKCMECDKFHASCMDANAEKIKEKIINASYNKLDYFYDEYDNNLPKVLDEFSRPVVEYHCPMLGYRELLFPINYSGNILGVLFVGQIIVDADGDKEKVIETIDSFFSKPINDPKQIFETYINLYNEKNKKILTSDIIVNLIKESNNILIPFDEMLNFDKDSEEAYRYYRKNFDTRVEYINFIKDACKKIEDIEKKFIKIFSTKKKNYFYKITKKIVDGFFKNYSDRCTKEQRHLTNKHAKRETELELAWNELSIVANKIKESFDLDDITIFGDGKSVNIVESNKKKVYPLQNNAKKSWYYDFSFIKQYLSTAYDYTTNFKHPEILNGLSKHIIKDNCIMILYHDIAFLIKVKSLKQYEEIYKIMSDVIGESLLKISSVIALCSANFMKERHLLTLRMNRHESAHISTRLNDSMKRYFSNYGKTFVNLDSEKQKLVVDDMQNTIHLISHMANNIGLITGSINESNIFGKIKYLDVYDLLYKWQIMFRNELKGRNLDIIILRNSDENVLDYILQDSNKSYRDGPRYLYINSELFELLVYNLVDNAVKYAYRGSKIYLSWHIVYDEAYELTVSSFGPEMKDGEALYELYARGVTAQLHVASGDGIGLYVVKRIAKLLKLEVDHTSNLISKYNLPIIPWYIKENFNVSNKKEHQAFCDLISDEYYHLRSDLIVNNNAYTSIERRDLSKEYLNSRIAHETYNTTFKIKIKINEG